jgi:thioredoxin-like negative regulator of GroEL
MSSETSNLQKIGEAEFVDQVIAGKCDALVKFSPSWSGSGQMLGYSLESLAIQYKESIRFFSFEFDSDSALCSTYQIDNTPAILFFKKGTLVDRLSGLVQKDIISQKIQQLINF